MAVAAEGAWAAAARVDLVSYQRLAAALAACKMGMTWLTLASSRVLGMCALSQPHFLPLTWKERQSFGAKPRVAETAAGLVLAAPAHDGDGGVLTGTQTIKEVLECGVVAGVGHRHQVSGFSGRIVEPPLMVGGLEWRSCRSWGICPMICPRSSGGPVALSSWVWCSGVGGMCGHESWGTG